MSANIRIGGATVDGMTIEIFRRLDSAYPYVIIVSGRLWTLTVEEALKLAKAATFHPVQSGRHRQPGPRYRGHAAGEDGRAFGVEVTEAADVLYFSFDGARASGRIGEGGDLEWLFERLAADVAGVRKSARASGPQQLLVNLRTYRGPLAWRGE
jgi:hypothetical protein